MKKKVGAHTMGSNASNYLRYKDYFGTIRVDIEQGMLFGHVVGTNDKISYQGKSVEELNACFKESIDEYIDFCKEVGKKPEKSFSGNILFRSNPELHSKIALAAQKCGKSINSWLNDVVEGACTKEYKAC